MPEDGEWDTLVYRADVVDVKYLGQVAFRKSKIKM